MTETTTTTPPVDDSVVAASDTKKQVYFNKEHNVKFECWLNLYHDMEVDPMTVDHYTSMSDEERETYTAFLGQVKNINWDDVEGIDPQQPLVLPDDLTCLRFLQADKYNTETALKRLMATLLFHQEYKVAQIMSNQPQKLESYRKLRARAMMGMTKDGMPIFVERLGHFMCGITSVEGKALTGQEYIECFLYDLGLLISSIRKSHEETSQNDKVATTWKATWIMDCAGIRYFRALKSMSTLKLIDSVTEPNFPELAGPIYLINAPTVASALWRVAKNFLDPTVAAKIEIHSGVPTELLESRIDKSVLFEEYGGTNSGHFPKAEYTM